jgi:hypothetical protein
MKEITLWKNFSKYIRMKECIETTGSHEFGKCCCCSRIINFSNLDAGHFVSRNAMSIKYDERNVHIQCRYCNRFDAENAKIKYYEYMKKRYGQNIINLLINEKFSRKKYNKFEIKEMNKIYLEKIKEIKSKK